MMHRRPLLRAAWWLLASGWMGACSGAHEQTQTNSVITHAKVASAANVPALLRLSIDDLHGRLRNRQPLPASLGTIDDDVPEAAKRITNSDSLASFRAGGLTLIANYNAQTRKVHELVVLGHHEDSLMASATLRSNASQYLVLPVFASNRPNHLLGLRVVPIE